MDFLTSFVKENEPGCKVGMRAWGVIREKGCFPGVSGRRGRGRRERGSLGGLYGCSYGFSRSIPCLLTGREFELGRAAISQRGFCNCCTAGAVQLVPFAYGPGCPNAPPHLMGRLMPYGGRHRNFATGFTGQPRSVGGDHSDPFWLTMTTTLSGRLRSILIGIPAKLGSAPGRPATMCSTIALACV